MGLRVKDIGFKGSRVQVKCEKKEQSHTHSLWSFEAQRTQREKTGLLGFVGFIEFIGFKGQNIGFAL